MNTNNVKAVATNIDVVLFFIPAPVTSPKESRVRPRAVNLDVTIGATRILHILVMRWTSGLVCAHAVIDAVARQTQLVHSAKPQQSWIGGSVWCVTRHAAFSLQWRVFVGERTLFVCVALDASRICSCGQSCLF